MLAQESMKAGCGYGRAQQAVLRSAGTKRSATPDLADEGRLLNPSCAASRADTSHAGEEDSRRASSATADSQDGARGAQDAWAPPGWAGAGHSGKDSGGAGQPGASRQPGVLELLWLLRGHRRA